MLPSPSGSIPLPWLRWRGLNLQLFLFIFLPVTGILLLITFGSLTLHQTAMRNLVGERDERASRTAATAISEAISYRGTAIRGLASRAGDHNTPHDILSSSAYLDPEFDFGMAIFTPDGELLAATDYNSLWTTPPIELHDLLTQALARAGSQAIFSISLPHPDNGDLFMFVAAAATVDSPVAVGAFSPVSLSRRTLASAFALGEQSAAFIVDQNSQVIYQTGALSPSESAHTHPGVSEALRGESGTTYVDVDGSEHVVAFSPVQSTGWALVIEEPWESVANPLLNTTQFAPLVLVPLILLSMVALWFGARQIIQPLQALESLSSELAWGDYQSIEVPVGGIDEIGRLQRTLIHLAQKIKRYQAGLRGYIGAITTGQEDERQRLARELHDGTIQALIALDQRIQLAQLGTNNNPTLDVSLEEIHTMTQGTIDDIRRFVRALRPLYLEELGLVAALEMLVHETSGSATCLFDFQQLGIARRIPPETELALYRMAQEGLNNVVRHAEAVQASLCIDFKKNAIVLAITDDGVGFDVPDDPADFALGGHFGLLGMHERAELIGARLEIKSVPGEGTRLAVILTM